MTLSNETMAPPTQQPKSRSQDYLLSSTPLCKVPSTKALRNPHTSQWSPPRGASQPEEPREPWWRRYERESHRCKPATPVARSPSLESLKNSQTSQATVLKERPRPGDASWHKERLAILQRQHARAVAMFPTWNRSPVSSSGSHCPAAMPGPVLQTRRGDTWGAEPSLPHDTHLLATRSPGELPSSRPISQPYVPPYLRARRDNSGRERGNVSSNGSKPTTSAAPSEVPAICPSPQLLTSTTKNALSLGRHDDSWKERDNIGFRSSKPATSVTLRRTRAHSGSPSKAVAGKREGSRVRSDLCSLQDSSLLLPVPPWPPPLSYSTSPLTVPPEPPPPLYQNPLATILSLSAPRQCPHRAALSCSVVTQGLQHQRAPSMEGKHRRHSRCVARRDNEGRQRCRIHACTSNCFQRAKISRTYCTHLCPCASVPTHCHPGAMSVGHRTVEHPSWLGIQCYCPQTIARRRSVSAWSRSGAISRVVVHVRIAPCSGSWVAREEPRGRECRLALLHPVPWFRLFVLPRMRHVVALSMSKPSLLVAHIFVCIMSAHHCTCAAAFTTCIPGLRSEGRLEGLLLVRLSAVSRAFPWESTEAGGPRRDEHLGGDALGSHNAQSTYRSPHVASSCSADLTSLTEILRLQRCRVRAPLHSLDSSERSVPCALLQVMRKESRGQRLTRQHLVLLVTEHSDSDLFSSDFEDAKHACEQGDDNKDRAILRSSTPHLHRAALSCCVAVRGLPQPQSVETKHHSVLHHVEYTRPCRKPRARHELTMCDRLAAALAVQSKERWREKTASITVAMASDPAVRATAKTCTDRHLANSARYGVISLVPHCSIPASAHYTMHVPLRHAALCHTHGRGGLMVSADWGAVLSLTSHEGEEYIEAHLRKKFQARLNQPPAPRSSQARFAFWTRGHRRCAVHGSAMQGYLKWGKMRSGRIRVGKRSGTHLSCTNTSSRRSSAMRRCIRAPRLPWTPAPTGPRICREDPAQLPHIEERMRVRPVLHRNHPNNCVIRFCVILFRASHRKFEHCRSVEFVSEERTEVSRGSRDAPSAFSLYLYVPRPARAPVRIHLRWRRHTSCCLRPSPTPVLPTSFKSRLTVDEPQRVHQPACACQRVQNGFLPTTRLWASGPRLPTSPALDVKPYSTNDKSLRALQPASAPARARLATPAFSKRVHMPSARVYLHPLHRSSSDNLSKLHSRFRDCVHNPASRKAFTTMPSSRTESLNRPRALESVPSPNTRTRLLVDRPNAAASCQSTYTRLRVPSHMHTHPWRCHSSGCLAGVRRRSRGCAHALASRVAFAMYASVSRFRSDSVDSPRVEVVPLLDSSTHLYGHACTHLFAQVPMCRHAPRRAYALVSNACPSASAPFSELLILFMLHNAVPHSNGDWLVAHPSRGTQYTGGISMPRVVVSQRRYPSGRSGARLLFSRRLDVPLRASELNCFAPEEIGNQGDECHARGVATTETDGPGCELWLYELYLAKSAREDVLSQYMLPNSCSLRHGQAYGLRATVAPPCASLLAQHASATQALFVGRIYALASEMRSASCGSTSFRHSRLHILCVVPEKVLPRKRTAATFPSAHCTRCLLCGRKHYMMQLGASSYTTALALLHLHLHACTPPLSVCQRPPVAGTGTTVHIRQEAHYRPRTTARRRRAQGGSVWAQSGGRLTRLRFTLLLITHYNTQANLLSFDLDDISPPLHLVNKPRLEGRRAMLALHLHLRRAASSCCTVAQQLRLRERELLFQSPHYSRTLIASCAVATTSEHRATSVTELLIPMSALRCLETLYRNARIRSFVGRDNKHVPCPFNCAHLCTRPFVRVPSRLRMPRHTNVSVEQAHGRFLQAKTSGLSGRQYTSAAATTYDGRRRRVSTDCRLAPTHACVPVAEQLLPGTYKFTTKQDIADLRLYAGFVQCQVALQHTCALWYWSDLGRDHGVVERLARLHSSPWLGNRRYRPSLWIFIRRRAAHRRSEERLTRLHLVPLVTEYSNNEMNLFSFYLESIVHACGDDDQARAGRPWSTLCPCLHCAALSRCIVIVTRGLPKPRCAERVLSGLQTPKFFPTYRVTAGGLWGVERSKTRTQHGIVTYREDRDASSTPGPQHAHSEQARQVCIQACPSGANMSHGLIMRWTRRRRTHMKSECGRRSRRYTSSREFALQTKHVRSDMSQIAWRPARSRMGQYQPIRATLRMPNCVVLKSTNSGKYHNSDPEVSETEYVHAAANLGIPLKSCHCDGTRAGERKRGLLLLLRTGYPADVGLPKGLWQALEAVKVISADVHVPCWADKGRGVEWSRPVGISPHSSLAKHDVAASPSQVAISRGALETRLQPTCRMADEGQCKLLEQSLPGWKEREGSGADTNDTGEYLGCVPRPLPKYLRNPPSPDADHRTRAYIGASRALIVQIWLPVAGLRRSWLSRPSTLRAVLVVNRPPIYAAAVCVPRRCPAGSTPETPPQAATKSGRTRELLTTPTRHRRLTTTPYTASCRPTAACSRSRVQALCARRTTRPRRCVSSRAAARRRMVHHYYIPRYSKVFHVMLRCVSLGRTSRFRKPRHTIGVSFASSPCARTPECINSERRASSRAGSWSRCKTGRRYTSAPARHLHAAALASALLVWGAIRLALQGVPPPLAFPRRYLARHFAAFVQQAVAERGAPSGAAPRSILAVHYIVDRVERLGGISHHMVLRSVYRSPTKPASVTTPAPAHAPPAYAPCSHPAYVSCPQAYGAFALPPRVRVRALLARAPTYVPCPQTHAASGSAYVRTCVRIVHAPFPPPRARRASPARAASRAQRPPTRRARTPRTCRPAGVHAVPSPLPPRMRCACVRGLLTRAPAYVPCSQARARARVRAVIAAAPAHAPRPRTRTLLAHAPEYVRCVPAGACRERERMCTCHVYAPWPPSRTHRPHAQRPRPRKCRAVAPAPRMRRACVRAVPVRARHERECISAHVPRTHRARAVPGPAHAPSPEHSAHAPHVRTCLPARGARLRARTRRHGGRPCPRACTRTLLAHPAYVPCLAPRAARRERERMCTCHVYAPCPPSCTVPMPVYAPPAYAPCSRLYPRTRMRM
ncbi:hypothetical protein GGX14DRAFT_574806 [Mycena pura]|uniref:Uncharacterized protein n=1 Tax=Mycena pura TaxID=153505 RepID=A0AAD6Y4P4_9AGAR|nr:hypothetical protein GGX14DRAFT_574806 [Mycena pura]